MSGLLWVLAIVSALLGVIVLAQAESVLHEILAFTAFIDAAILLVGAIVADTIKEQAGRIVGCLLCDEALSASARSTAVVEGEAENEAEEWERYKCPGCGKRIPRAATTCEHCGRKILPLTESPAVLSGKKLCAKCGKRVSWNDAITWRDGIRYHSPCARSA